MVIHKWKYLFFPNVQLFGLYIRYVVNRRRKKKKQDYKTLNVKSQNAFPLSFKFFLQKQKPLKHTHQIKKKKSPKPVNTVNCNSTLIYGRLVYCTTGCFFSEADSLSSELFIEIPFFFFFGSKRTNDALDIVTNTRATEPKLFRMEKNTEKTNNDDAYNVVINTSLK